MSRASKACSEPTCPNLQPCSLHERKPWAGSTRRHRLPSNWEAIRRVILDRDPVCRGCYLMPSRHVDHILNNDDHSYGNLQGLCVECHREKTQQEARRAKKGRALAVAVFSLVGLPASGKTMVRDQLAEEFGVETFTIDNAADWSDYIDQIEQARGVVVAESNIVPPRYRLLLSAVPHRMVEVVSSQSDRRQRLENRGITDPANYLTHHRLAPTNAEAIDSGDYETIKERFQDLMVEMERRANQPTMNQLIRGG